MKTLAPLLGCLLLVGCSTFPVSLYVDAEALEQLEHTRFVEHTDPERVTEEVRRRLGWDGAPVELLPALYSRVDLGPDPRSEASSESSRGARSSARHRTQELTVADHPALFGLASGDLILVQSRQPRGLLRNLAFEHLTEYGHMGVLVFDGDEPFVFESWPQLDLLGRYPDFASRFRGKVARAPLADFAKRYAVLEFVRLPDPAKRSALVDAAWLSLDEDIRFDPYHDPARPEMGCSEYVLHLMDRAGYSTDVPHTRLGPNVGLRKMRAALGFELDAYLLPDSFAEIPGAESVGILTRHESLGEVRGLTEARRVLFDHFGATSSPGDLARPHGTKLIQHRANTLAYLEWAKGWLRAHPGASDRERFEALESLFSILFVPVES